MKLDVSQDETFQYLLGKLSPERAEEIERQILEDGDFHQEVNICERELLDRYVQNALTSAERSIVEQRFIASQRRRQQLFFAAALQQKIEATSRSRPWKPSGLNSVSLPMVGYKWVAAALLMLATLLGLQDFRLGRRLRRSEENLALLNRQLENAAGHADTPPQTWGPQDAVMVAALSPTERGQTNHEISVSEGVRAVQFRLSVPEDWRDDASVQLMNDRGNVIATPADARAQRIGNSRFLIATFALDLLPDGNYFLHATAKAHALPGSPRHSDYAFKINRE